MGWFGDITGKHPAFVLAVWAPAFAAFAVVLHFGWRGVALPILQRHMAPLWAGLIIGFTWGLWPTLFHFQVNNPLWPDAQPYDTYFFVVVALLVVWVNCRTMRTRDGAITEVFALENQASSLP